MNHFDLDTVEQAALFGTMVNHDLVDFDKLEGASGLYGALAYNAVQFFIFHMPADGSDIWESIDWYIASDEWFAENIVPEIYK
jgi:hypothetical protein